MHDVIRAPAQERSRQTMAHVYRSMDALLRERSFDRITIAELATHADVAVGSIYARFKDKNALLAGLYLRSCEQAERCLSRQASAARRQAKTDEELVRATMVAVDRFYRDQGHVLVAATMADVPQIDSSRVQVWQHALTVFGDMLVQRHPDADPAMLRKAVQVAIRIVTAVMQQRMVIGSVTRWEGRVSDKLVNAELIRLVLDLLDRARSGTLS